MHWASLSTILLIALAIPFFTLLAVVFYYGLRKYNFVKWAVVTVFSLSAAGAIVLLIDGKHESRMKMFVPKSTVAISAHSAELHSFPTVPPNPNEIEIQAHIDTAISNVQIVQRRIENQIQLQIDAMEGDVALAIVHDHPPSRRRLFKRGFLGTSLVIGFVMFAFLYICYLFLDAGTRGQFTWSLRIISLFAFIMMMIAIQVLHHRELL